MLEDVCPDRCLTSGEVPVSGYSDGVNLGETLIQQWLQSGGNRVNAVEDVVEVLTGRAGRGA